LGTLFFKVSVVEQIYMDLIVYGWTTPRRKPDSARGVQDSLHDDNHALAFHTKKGRRNRRSFNKAFKDKKTSSTSGHEHKKDNSRIQCFGCDKYGHIVRNCPTRKKGRQLASTVDVDRERHQRDEDIKDEAFFFI
jgi:hypothetical protein